MKRRLLLAAAAVVAIAAVLLSRSQPTSSPHTQFFFEIERTGAVMTLSANGAADNTAGEFAEALRRLRALELRDSLVELVRSDAVTGTRPLSVVVRGSALAVGDSTRFSVELDRQWQNLAIQKLWHPVIAFVSIATSTPAEPVEGRTHSVHEAEGWDLVFAPPRRGSSDPCLVVLRVVVPTHPADGMTDLRELVLRTPLLGACAYYAAFGQPGPEIERWLSAREFDVARSSWTRQGRIRATSRHTSYYVVHPLTQRWSPEYTGLSAGHFFAAQRCTDGERDACRALVLDPELHTLSAPRSFRRWESAMPPTDVTTLSFMPGMSNMLVTEYLADLVESVGRERFARFWQSNETPAAAFESAIGEPIGDWTRDWVYRAIGQTTRGTQVPVTTVLIAIVLALVGLGAATVVGIQRSVR